MTQLSLPQVWERKIQQIVYDNRMDYELWAQTAKSFEAVKESLLQKGYTNLPSGANNLLDLEGYSKAPKAETKSCKTKKTMTRKKK